MNAVSFPHQNITFTKPENMTDEECGSLPAFKGEGHLISCWKLSEDDLKRVNETGIIWFDMLGNQQPPICLSTESPFND